MPEMLAAGQDSAKQNRSVNRRHFRIPHPLSGIDVCEVIEKTAVLGQLLPQEAKPGNRPFHRGIPRYETAPISNAKRREAKTSGRNAGHDSLVVDVDVATVLNHPRLRAGLFPEIKEIGVFKFVEEEVVFGRQRGCSRRFGSSLRQCQQPGWRHQFSQRQAQTCSDDLPQRSPAGKPVWSSILHQILIFDLNQIWGREEESGMYKSGPRWVRLLL